MANRKSQRNELVRTPNSELQPTSNQTPPAPEKSGVYAVSTSYSGPLLPQHIEAYEKTEAGRLYIRGMIKQSNHRMELENIVIRGDDKRANLGQWFGLTIALVFGGLGSWLVHAGHDMAGATIATGPVVGLAYAFITGSSQRMKERTQKAKLMSGQKEAPAQLGDEQDKDSQLPGITPSE